MLLLSSSGEFHTTLPVEICDNALDDDNDGRIDLNDEDCGCLPLKPESLIPNPSFEEQNCCPEQHSAVNCATSWLQASTATSDYYHSCNQTTMANVPQPIPDGEGCVGFNNGVFNGDFNPGWKEYVGTCLIDTLQADSIYKFQFYVGFSSKRTSPEISIAIFGTNDCANLPFGGEDPSFGCPSNSPDWIHLGAIGVAGENEWKQHEFTLKPKFDITTVAIGPDCYHLSLSNNPYHFLDNLILAKNIEFEVDIEVNGAPCAEDLSFEIAEKEGFHYQWYKDGVAIVGATSATLNHPKGQGSYQVRVSNEKGCNLSEPHFHRPPFKTTSITQIICRGTSYPFDNQELTAAGNYIDTLKTINNCDSIIRLELKLEDAIETSVSAKIFPTESYKIGAVSLNEAGEYVRTIPSHLGCDSTVYLKLEHYSVYIPNIFSPNEDGRNDRFSIQGGQDLQTIPVLKIFDRWGNLMYQGTDLAAGEGWNGRTNGVIASSGVYAYIAEIVMEDEKKRIVEGMMMLMK